MSEIEKANSELERVTKSKIWNLISDVTKYKTTEFRVNEMSYRKQIEQGLKLKLKFKKPNNDVLSVARFIANIEPGYYNSQNEFVTLTSLRTINPDILVNNLDFIVEQLRKEVYPYIRVSSTSKEVSDVYYIKTSMPKKKLVVSAIEHLLIGNQLFDDPKQYHLLKAHSMYRGKTIALSLSVFIGVAIQGRYKSVYSLFDDLVLQLVDQEETLRRDLTVSYYQNGSIRTEVFI